MLLVQLQAYRQQYGFNGIYVIPTNLYGPGDQFDLETSHVIPALIHKCVEAQEAGREEVALWGTGTASREFLYVDDAAEAIVTALERYDAPEPLNLGAEAELTICELAELVAQVTGFSGKFVWDPSYPDGRPRRSVDGTKARQLLDWEPKVTLAEGLAETVAWFRAHRAPSRGAWA
jgi:GDP-L-fucose synthase